jgi:hypothetical protein
MLKEQIWKAILSSSSGSKEVHSEHKHADSYTVCGLRHVKHYVPLSEKFAYSVQCQEKER